MAARRNILQRVALSAWSGAMGILLILSITAAVFAARITTAQITRLSTIPGASAYGVGQYVVLSPVSTAFPPEDVADPLLFDFQNAEDYRLAMGLVDASRFPHHPPRIFPGPSGVMLVGWYGYPALVLERAWLYAPVACLCVVALTRAGWWLARLRPFLLITTPIALLLTVQSAYLSIRIGTTPVDFVLVSGLLLASTGGPTPDEWVDTQTTIHAWPVPFAILATGSFNFIGIAVWLPVLVVPLWCWFSNWRRRRRHDCQNCGYDLTGNTSRRCPECGTPVPPTTREAGHGQEAVSKQR